MEDDKLTRLKDRIAHRMPKIAEILKQDFRKRLDSKTTILDISYESLKVNVYKNRITDKQEAAYKIIYDKFISVVREARKGKTCPSLDSDKFTELFTSKKSPGAILVDNGTNENIFLVGINFDAIRTFVSNYVSNHPNLKNTRFGSTNTTIVEDKINKLTGRSVRTEKTITMSKVDIGHIPTAENENLESPLELKFLEILKTVKETNSTVNTRIAEATNRALQELYDIQFDIQYDFKNTTPEAIALARKTFANGYIVVTLHTKRKNNQFSVLEKRTYDKLLYEIAMLAAESPSFPGSNTVIQDIEQAVVNALKGKKSIKSHPAQAGMSTGSLNLSPKKTSANASTKLNAVKENLTAANTYSLTSLQNLINTHLQDVISANMGSGSSRNILNYQTGRFAASAKVERMSESREGMITAFYSYMKNPYQTFEPSFRQGSPKTRDPKLLIASSIREIAASKVGNRMRAVLL